MIENRAYAYDLSVPEIVPEHMPNKKDFKIVKAPKKVAKTNANNAKKTKAKPQSKLSLVLSVVALFTIKLMMKIVKRGNWIYFSIYLFLLSIFVLLNQYVLCLF